MSDQEAKIKEHWKELMRGLGIAKVAWEKFQKLRLEMPSIEHLPLEWQKVMTRVPYRAKFEVALEQMMIYWRRSGGIEVFRVTEELDEKDQGGDE